MHRNALHKPKPARPDTNSTQPPPPRALRRTPESLFPLQVRHDFPDVGLLPRKPIEQVEVDVPRLWRRRCPLNQVEEERQQFVYILCGENRARRRGGRNTSCPMLWGGGISGFKKNARFVTNAVSSRVCLKAAIYMRCLCTVLG